MTRGDLVWYRQSVRGGYDAPGLLVPAIWLNETPKRVLIHVLLRDGTRRLIAVNEDRLTPRRVEEGLTKSR